MKNHIEYMRKYVGFSSSCKMLDVGSGRGDFLVEAAVLGYNVSGVELNPENIIISKKKIEERSLSAEIINSNAESLPFADSTFGFVNCSEVTEHVEDPVKVLSEIYRVLIPGGVAYISFHNRYGYKDQHFNMVGINWLPRFLADKICIKTTKIKNYNKRSGHQLLGEMHYYTYSQIKKILTHQNFIITDIRELRISASVKNHLLKVFAIFLYRLYRATFINTFHLLVTK